MSNTRVLKYKKSASVNILHTLSIKQCASEQHKSSTLALFKKCNNCKHLKALAHAWVCSYSWFGGYEL